MKSYKKYLPCIAIIILIFTAAGFLLSRPAIQINGCSSDNVYNTIKELSSDKYMGRAFGTKGNEEAVKYIESQFQAIGLKPAGENGTYLRNYSEIAKSYNGEAVLELLNSSGKIIKRYNYGEDFIEQSYGLSCSGEVTSDWNYLSDSDIASPKNCGGNEIAVSRTTAANNYYPSLYESKYKAFVRLVDDSVNFKKESAVISGKNLKKIYYEMPTILVKGSAASELYNLSGKGYKLHLKSTFNVDSKKVSDVLGMIPGSGDEYLFITAHLDHVGPSSNGTIYPGALDNASGVGTMLEVARYIKSQNKKPIKNIVFIAFNAEEGGLLGSEDYVRHPLYPLYTTTVINLDMVGANKDMPITLAYNTVKRSTEKGEIDPSSNIRYYLKNIAARKGYAVNEVNKTFSDHALFNFYGVPAVTLINMDMDKVHSPSDNIKNIGKENIGKILNLVTGYIALNAYANFSVNGYSIVKNEIVRFIKVEYPLFIVLVLSILLYSIAKRKNILSKIRGPIFTLITILTLLGIISYMQFMNSNLPVNQAETLGLLKTGFDSILKSFILFPYFILFMLPGLISLFAVNSKIHRWTYQGDGKEYNTIFRIAMLSVVVTSLYLVAMYNTPVYIALTPNFARSVPAKIILNAVIALISYGVYKLLCSEINIKVKGYRNYIAFSLILFILLSSFYAPIFINKTTFSANSRGVDIKIISEEEPDSFK